MNKIKLITVFVLVSVFIVSALFILHGAAKQNDAAGTTGTTDVTGTTNTTAAAQTTSFATLATSATKISPPPLPPPDYITGMQFDRDFYKAKAFIEKNDISEFSGKDKENFAKTMEIYHADGFLINATSSNADEMLFLYLSPRQVSRLDKTETMPGLAYGIYMGEEYYILKVCNAEEERLKKAKEIYGENFETGYFALAGGQLYGSSPYSGTNLGEAKNFYTHHEMKYLYFWLDGSHYVQIQGLDKYTDPKSDEVSVNILTLLEGLEFEKVPLETGN